MPRYVAFLRGVSPMNAKMSDLKRCFESAGFTDVRTVLSSGNVVFNARTAPRAAVQRKVEAAMAQQLDRPFRTAVRSITDLRALLDADPYAEFELPSNAKRVVTFLFQPPDAMPALPAEVDGARILATQGSEVLSAYVPSPRSPVFMALIERTFGAEVTTRTWDTVRKCAAA